MTTHEILVEQVKSAIDRLFEDSSVTMQETAESLESIIEKVEIMLEILR